MSAGRRVVVVGLGFIGSEVAASLRQEQYTGFHTTWDRLIVRGSIESGSFLAFYVNDGRIDAVVGLNRAKDVRRAIPLIKARRAESGSAPGRQYRSAIAQCHRTEGVKPQC
jgi:hypothetical protein